jgi:predicted HTH transcriptional regulator
MEEKGCGCEPGKGMEMMKKMGESMGGMPPMMEKCMQMGQQMTGAVIEMGKMASFATPEIRGLFEEWVKEVEGEILEFLKEKQSSTPGEIADKIKLSEESVLILIGKLAREGKLKITGVQL